MFLCDMLLQYQWGFPLVLDKSPHIPHLAILQLISRLQYSVTLALLRPFHSSDSTLMISRYFLILSWQLQIQETFDLQEQRTFTFVQVQLMPLFLQHFLFLLQNFPSKCTWFLTFFLHQPQIKWRKRSKVIKNTSNRQNEKVHNGSV